MRSRHIKTRHNHKRHARPKVRQWLNHAIGVAQTAFGSALLAYVAAWLTGMLAWAADITFALMGGLGVVCLAAGITRLRLSRPMIVFKNRGLNTACRCICAVCTAVALCVQGLILSQVIRADDQTDAPAGCVIIMGARIYGGTPSSMLAARIDAAARILAANPGAIAVACGGYPEGNSFSEAQVIRNRLSQLGISPSRVLLDEESSDTRQSAANAHHILREAGYDGAVTIATSDYHLYRCLRHFRLLGYQAYGTGSQVALALRPVAHFREMISIMRDFVYALLGA